MKSPLSSMKWAGPSLILLLSAGVFVAAVMLPTHLEGQPQGKEKAKQKAKQTAVKTTTLATDLWHPWSLAWLPNGDMLVTERNGKLRMLRDNRLDPEPIAGVPAVHSVRLSGLMEVLPHPNFAQNQIVYLTYTKDVGPDLVATTLARGRLQGKQLVELKDIVVCDPWAGDGGSGSRLAWGRDGMLYMTTGASNGNAAQEGGSLRVADAQTGQQGVGGVVGAGGVGAVQVETVHIQRFLLGHQRQRLHVLHNLAHRQVSRIRGQRGHGQGAAAGSRREHAHNRHHAPGVVFHRIAQKSQKSFPAGDQTVHQQGFQVSREDRALGSYQVPAVCHLKSLAASGRRPV